MKNKPLVYIAGALRADIPTYIANCSRMIKIAEEVRQQGYAVFVPCLDLLSGIVIGNLKFDDYFNNSFEILKRCDCVFLVPGWQSSEGTKREIELAKRYEISVFEDIKLLKRTI